jgi:hypothetical protein
MARSCRLQFGLRSLLLAMLVLGTLPWLIHRHLRWRDAQLWQALDAARQQRDQSLIQWREVYSEYQTGSAPLAAESAARERYFAARQQVAGAVGSLRARYEGSPGGLERAAQLRADVMVK